MKILLLAYYFPPDSSSGSFRPLFFANHLTRNGDEIRVLTSRIDHYLEEQGLDENLLSVLSEKVRITRCSVYRPREAVIDFRNRLFRKGAHAPEGISHNRSDTDRSGKSSFQKLKDTVTEVLATPDQHAGWLPDCIQRGKRIIDSEKPDLIFATGGPWTGLLAGALLKKLSGVPLVLDFRDPWVSNPTSAERPILCRVLDRWLERFVVTMADVIVANTAELRKDFLTRYSMLREHYVFTITNGFEDYLPVTEKPHGSPLTITHTGALYFNRNPARLLEAVAGLLESGAIGKSEIRLQFIGGIQIEDPSIQKILPALIEDGVVRVIPRVPYAEAKQYDQQADILLLIQPDFPLQIPRKLYEYMATRKRMFCIAERESATSRIIENNQLGYVSENNQADIKRCILEILEYWRTNGSMTIMDDRLDKFRNEHLAEILKQAIHKACGQKHEETSCPVSQGKRGAHE